MANCNQRRNFIDKIKIGDRSLEKDEEIISGIANFYEGLFKEDGVSRPLVDNVEFDSILVEEASWLERPFDEAEMLVALKSLNGDKAPGPDGMSLAFFQHCWGVIKAFQSSFVGKMALAFRKRKGKIVEKGCSSKVRLRLGRMVFFSCQNTIWGCALEGNYEWVGGFCKHTRMMVGGRVGRRVKFWEHVWCGDVSLRDTLPNIYRLACDKDADVFDYLHFHDGVTMWDIQLRREVHEREVEDLMTLLARVYGMRRVDEMRWTLSKAETFQVKSFYKALCGGGGVSSFPRHAIWQSSASIKSGKEKEKSLGLDSTLSDVDFMAGKKLETF
ncbi:hypothetical protein RHMOL_Rhmol08G0179000 [Rhododendron molle]|uniref:Uncharacterized protein n=1 Tax=Rhododendron molle TaxID=49168 RepID=A0ACC0MPW2_RHOML|nr:hypothetical protein RHMOL_Rhmol08G0179000 [Rhododendron molle]